MYTTNKTISILICSKMIDSLLCKFSRNVLQKYRLRDKLDQVGCTRAFGPRWASNPVGPIGPRVDSYGGQDLLSGSTTKSTTKTTTNKHMMCFCVE